MQDAGKTANAYKTILVNLMTGSEKLEKQFNKFNISMKDNNTGALKDGYTLLQELSVAYQNIGQVWDEDTQSMKSMDEEMNQLLESVAGGQICLACNRLN